MKKAWITLKRRAPWAAVIVVGLLSLGSGTYSFVYSTPWGCSNPTHKTTTVGLTAGNCPSTQNINRRFVTYCNSSENSGTPTIKIRIDGTAPVTGLGNAGDVLAVGACVTYNIGAGTVPQCIASAAGTGLTSLECQ